MRAGVLTRALVVVLVAAAAHVFSAGEMAYADNTTIGVEGQGYGVIIHSDSGSIPGAEGGAWQGGGAPGSDVSHSGSASGPTFYATMPEVRDSPVGQCLYTQYTPEPSQAAATANSADSFDWQQVSLQYPPCPGPAPSGAGGPPAVAPPGAVAASFWQDHGVNLLSRPGPHIAPGYALTGNPGYLETGAQLAQSFSDPTPAGTLDISAHGQLYVDWGDGSGWSGPYDTPGAPWPTGTITHVWADVGRYDVVVQERWSATWSLGGASGSLTSLQTQGSIPAFEVRQLESVRNR